MKHYSESEWLTFKHHLAEKPEAEKMENHLLNCDHCLNLFLTLTDEAESARVEIIIPPDFSRHTMAFIHRHQTPQPRTVSGRDKIKRLLSYYVAAAMVTIVLMSGGFFETVARSASLISASSIIKAEKPNSIIFTWPTRLIETSSSWTQLIPKETKNIKEVIW
jgi:hypothetical protein